MSTSRLAARPLHRARAAAQQLAAAAGVHGVYVRNALARGEGRGFVFGPGAGSGLCWVGPRGNLVLAMAAADAQVAVLADGVADLLLRRPLPWRVAMGPAALLAALARRGVRAPLVHREQVYYVGDAASCNRLVAAHGVRRADERDRSRLEQATLELNHSDLCIDPARVDRIWLRDTIAQRIAVGSTWVLGPPGELCCKLDVGSSGPFGTIVEGVFTFAAARGHGFAAALVAACVAAQPGLVALHVAAGNTPARRAYERAGMREAARCWLLLAN
jgi:predicted GNAT family acetyltransferase